MGIDIRLKSSWVEFQECDIYNYCVQSFYAGKGTKVKRL